MAKKTSRDDELSKRPRIRDRLLDVFKDVESGFIDQRERSNEIKDNWDIYNCVLNEKQFYNGNSEIYLPIVNNAVDARKTRFTNQIFPQAGRYVEVVTNDGELPHAEMSLIEHYIRRAKLRTRIIPSLMVNGDIEGQYSVYVSWKETSRHVVTREEKPVKVAGFEFEEFGTTKTLKKETLEEGCPDVEVLADSDVLVLPATVDDIEDALEQGGSVTVMRRWTKRKIEKMIDDGEFDEEAGDAFLKNFSGRGKNARVDTAKALAEEAGIKTNGSSKYALGYETWTKIRIDGEMRLCRAYYGGDDQILGCKLNPYWCDKCPILSGAVNKRSGVFKGIAPVKDVRDLQYFANDTVNEAADTSHFSAMPIIMTDPEKNPRVDTMVLGLAAVWQTNPQSTQFAQFPPLWKDCFDRINAIKGEIYESLGVNPAMMPQQTKTTKSNQAQVAQEQQVDLLMTADAVTNIEEIILTPVVQRMMEYDQQFRQDAVIIREFGEMGLKATMEEVEPITQNKNHEFRWFGVEAARAASQVQQQIATLGVVQKIPPQMYQGYRLDLVPVLTQIMQNTFGPRIAPLIFKSLKDELTVDPQIENTIMAEGMKMDVHPMDDDQQHIQVHQQALATDQSGQVKTHIQKHTQQLQMKQQAQMLQQAQAQGQQKGGGQGPKPGSQVRGPSQGKQPPGAINPDRMARAGSPVMPRKM